ncbi:Pao retrotransposon peptidase family protein [Aphelenchoides avenae]|nr:Pao retrotransposon peptidase family protein [Aphelenchus avenae]
MTDANYSVAINILKERFGKEEPIRQALYKELRNLPTPSAHASSLRNFEQQIEKLCRQLEKLGADLDQEEILYRLQDKLPRTVATELIKDKKSAAKWDTTTFRSKLNEYVELQEEIERTTASDRGSAQAASATSKSHFQKPVRGKAAGIFTTTFNEKSTFSEKNTSVVKDNSKARCVFCQTTGHWTTQCRKYATPDVRFEQAKRLNLCYRCMNSGHLRSECRATKPCFYCKARNHHSSFKKKNKGKKPTQRVFATTANQNGRERQDEDDEEADEAAPWAHVGVIKVAQLQAGSNSNGALLLTAKTDIFDAQAPQNKAKRTVFFDCGSGLSFITKDLAEQLQLKSLGREVINISTITTKKPKATVCSKHEVAVAHNDGSYAIIPVYALERITGEIPTVKVKPSEENVDKPWKIQVNSTPDSGYESSTPVSATWQPGGYPPNTTKPSKTSKSVQSYSKPMTRCQLMGITDDAMVSNDDLAAQQYAKTTTFKGRRYQVAYPYNSPHPDFPDNENLCKKRLNAFWYKYRNNPEVLQQVDDRFKEQEKKEIIEKATEMTGKHKHNLSFQIVLTPNKNTTKMRIVYDASARIRGHKSLNDNLFRGPVMLPDLSGLVLVLRTGEIVVVGDIEQAFLQVSVRPEDRDITRFMWLKDIAKPPSDDNIIVYRFTRVVFGIISSPFLLSATIKTHLQREGSELAKELSECIYSDNVLILATDVQEAIHKALRAKEIFNGASMNLREFVSNSAMVNQALGSCCEQLSSFLGVSWDIATDCFVLKANANPITEGVTKRIVLKQLASVYDPQKLLAPALLPAKLVFQETWQHGQDWNQAISVELLKQWKNAVADWSHVVIHVPRYVVSRDKGADLQLHAFADASKKACGVAVYIRCAVGNEVQVHILFGNSRLIPLKIDPTMPRRELISALLGIRALKFVAKHLRVNLNGKYLWSDSKVVISWILSDTTNMPVFLRNRVQEIQLSRDAEVGYVSTSEPGGHCIKRLHNERAPRL